MLDRVLSRRCFLALGLVTLAAACGDDDDAAPTATAIPGGGPASPIGAAAGTPSDLAGSISFAISGDPAEKAAYEALVGAFRVRYPNVEVDLNHTPDDGDYRQQLTTDFAAGNPPDIFLLNYRRYAPFAAEGQLEPLDAYLDASTVVTRADFFEQVFTPFTFRGALYAIPQNVSSLVVYYNTALFDAAGVAYPADDWTWDDFVTTAKALTLDANGDGTPEQWGLGTEAVFLRTAPFIWQNGGEIVDDPDNPGALLIGEPPAKEAIQWFVDLQVRHKVVPNPVQEAGMDSETRFQNGQIAMFLDSRRATTTLRQLDGLDWDVAPLPRGKQPASVLHSDGFFMAAKTADKAAAWAFIEFANSAEGQTLLVGTGRTVPSRKDVAQSPAFLDTSQRPSRAHVWLDAAPVARPVPVFPNWPKIESTLNEEIARAYRGDASVDEVIETALEDTAELLGDA